MYQLSRFKRGNATSRAPIISGSRKLPNTLGIDGMRKNHTITTPCKVNNRLYVSVVTRLPCGVINWRRIIVAAQPPMKKNTVIESRYKMPIRLWSWVVSHDFRP